jgi:hypothetical protein
MNGTCRVCGQLAILKRGWPALYNRFAAAHPEAASYT